MKKLVSLLLTLVMLLSLAALATAEDTGMAAWKPFEERVKITVPVYDRSKVGYPAVDNNYWTQWIQKEFGDKYNIDVQYVAIPRGDVMTKYSMLIAAGETPTIMMEYDYPKVAQWANDGAMTEISLEDFAKVAPTFYQAMVEHNQLGYTDINGKTYFVLTERPYYDTTFAFANFVRMDWLRKVGYDHVPASYEEHKDAMNKIIAAGLTDQPLGLGIPTAAYIVNFAFRDFPVDEKEWVMHSSLGTPGFPWYPTKRLLKRYNDEYHMGWYSSEFDLEKNSGGQGTDILQTDFINGKTYQYGGYIANNMAWLTAFYENNPDAELAIASPYAGVEEGVNTGAIAFPSFGLDPTHRVEVTVHDAAGTALPNADVVLTQEDGGVLWTAKTDKNGVAYLFEGAGTGTSVTVTAPDGATATETLPPLAADTQSETPLCTSRSAEITLESAPVLAPDMQVMFIVDTTGSMGDEMMYLQSDFTALTEEIEGDLNADGSFNTADLILMNKWLLSVPGTELANWKAGDFVKDAQLDVYDLVLMRKALIAKGQ